MVESTIETEQSLLNKRNTIKTAKGIISAFVLFLLIVFVALLPFAFSKEEKTYLTLENYKAIEIDMSYAKVVEILDGNEGTLLSISTNTGAYTHEVYQWNNSKETKVIVIQFHNKKVIFKDQMGLK